MAQATETIAAVIPANQSSSVNKQIAITPKRKDVLALVERAGLSLLRRLGIKAKNRHI
ncbi:MAG TPA: hypothetical protein VD947_02115 [Patescibacteria group bacterium]|nr:hypothetical protein [Patescibacteria group bacterium]